MAQAIRGLADQPLPSRGLPARPPRRPRADRASDGALFAAGQRQPPAPSRRERATTNDVAPIRPARAHRRRGEGLSAAVRDLHRAGDPGPRAGAASPSRSGPCAIRPTGSCTRLHRADRRARSATCRNTSTRRPCASCAASPRACGAPGFGAPCWRRSARDLRRDPTPNRVRRLGQAFVLARELPARCAIFTSITCTRRPPSRATPRS